MTPFQDLFFSHRDRMPGEQQTLVEQAFPSVVAASPFHLWRPGDPIPEQGLRLLIGVATWSGYDMRLLDVIAEAMAGDPENAPTVEVFSTAACKQQRDFWDYIPNLRNVYHTPAVGVWRDGQLIEAEEGYAARDLAARMFGSSSDQIVTYVTNWRSARTQAG